MRWSLYPPLPNQKWGKKLRTKKQVCGDTLFLCLTDPEKERKINCINQAAARREYSASLPREVAAYREWGRTPAPPTHSYDLRSGSKGNKKQQGTIPKKSRKVEYLRPPMYNPSATPGVEAMEEEIEELNRVLSQTINLAQEEQCEDQPVNPHLSPAYAHMHGPLTTPLRLISFGAGGLNLEIYHGNIINLQADAIINPANENLKHGGGVAQALSEAGGSVIQKESCELVKANGKVKRGEAVVTLAGLLPAMHVIHVVGPRGGDIDFSQKLIEAVLAALDKASAVWASSVSMPLISAGIFSPGNQNDELCMEKIARACFLWAGKHQGRMVKTIKLIHNDRRVAVHWAETCSRVQAEIMERGRVLITHQPRPVQNSTPNPQPLPPTASTSIDLASHCLQLENRIRELGQQINWKQTPPVELSPILEETSQPVSNSSENAGAPTLQRAAVTPNQKPGGSVTNKSQKKPLFMRELVATTEEIENDPLSAEDQESD
ncbi:UNVERIFIED_CONTAM: hypothetical protein FKN15_067536 [Acipenser sinensis]